MVTAISLVLSGGVSNIDPNSSLGGPSSPTPIFDVDNNLFSDVSGEQLALGLVDYRCFYIFNDNVSDDYANFKIWIEAQADGGSTCELGIESRNEKQTLTFVNVQSGTFKLSLDGHVTDSITFDFNTDVLSTDIQTALQALPNSTQAVVTFVEGKTYEVEWAALESNKKYPLLVLFENHLDRDNPVLQAYIDFAETQAGAPINAVAQDVGISTNPPANVTFSTPTADAPLTIGLLKPTEGFAVWIRRTTDPETSATDLDNLVFKCSGDRVINGLDA